MFRKCNPDGVLSITHFLPKKKKIENEYGRKSQKVEMESKRNRKSTITAKEEGLSRKI